MNIDTRLTKLALATGASTLMLALIVPTPAYADTACEDGGFTESLQCGDNSDASGENSTAVGDDSEASGFHSSAFGWKAEARGDESVAIGAGAHALGDRSTAVGQYAGATGDEATALGNEARATSLGATAIGYNRGCRIRKFNGVRQKFIGWRRGSDCHWLRCTSYWRWSYRSWPICKCFGYFFRCYWRSSQASARSTAVGIAATALGDDSAAFGRQSDASGSESVAMGALTRATSLRSIAIGSSSIADNENAIAMGYIAQAAGIGAIAFGEVANASALHPLLSAVPLKRADYTRLQRAFGSCKWRSVGCIWREFQRKCQCNDCCRFQRTGIGHWRHRNRVRGGCNLPELDRAWQGGTGYKR